MTYVGTIYGMSDLFTFVLDLYGYDEEQADKAAEVGQRLIDDGQVTINGVSYKFIGNKIYMEKKNFLQRLIDFFK